MKKLIISICLGIIAGIIDVIPMIIKGLNWYANISAFTHWVVMGILISYITINLKSWLKGFIFAELSAIPIAILVLQNDPKSIIPIIIMSAILGIFLGITCEKFAK